MHEAASAPPLSSVPVQHFPPFYISAYFLAMHTASVCSGAVRGPGHKYKSKEVACLESPFANPVKYMKAGPRLRVQS